jgi:predicted permease
MQLRFALRVLLKNRGITAIALLALALGIGANTAIFSVVEAVLLHPLPYRDADRLVAVLQRNENPLGADDFLDIRKSARSFESLAAAELWSGSLIGRDAPQQIVGMRVTEDLFHVLGRSAFRGRTIDASDFAPGAPHALVIGYGLWQRSFGAEDVVGRKVVLDSAPYTIVGVMPRDFYFAPFWVTQAEMWTQDDLAASNSKRGGGSLRAFGRLAPGVPIEAARSQAQADLNRIAANLAAAYPDSDTGVSLIATSLPERASKNIRPILQVLLGVVGMVLLIACANVANLALARATARRREVAVRIALGASRWVITRQFLTESIVLSLAGGALGVLLAGWGIRILQAMMRPDAGDFRARLLQADLAGLDPYVLLFTLALSLITGVLFGLAPSLLENRGSKNGSASSMKEGERGTTTSGSRLRMTLVASEIAVAIVLLIGSGLLLRSFMKLRAVDPGFDARNVVTMSVSVAGRAEYVGTARDTLYRSILDRVSAIPGVERASMTNHLPIAGDQWGFGYFVEGKPLPDPGHSFSAVYRSSRPGYFATMRTPILAGRDFNDGDAASAPAVVIINEALAKRHFGNESALGHRLSFPDPRKSPQWMTIVGVVHDVAQSWGDPAEPEVYVSYWQDPRLTKTTQPFAAYMTLVVRTQVTAESALDSVKNAVWSVDRNLPLSHAQTLEHAIGNATWESRFTLLLVGIFSALALILAMIGVYGVMAYEVAQRTHEIGIRMALGAARRGIMLLIARQSLTVALIGIACGLAAAAGLVRLMRTMLYQVDTLDPLTFAGVALVVFIVAAAAAVIPARNAMNVDPMIALRRE